MFRREMIRNFLYISKRSESSVFYYPEMFIYLWISE